MKQYGLETKLSGMEMPEYIAIQLEKIEKLEVENEKEKLKIAYLKQLNNHPRLRLDAAKLELKKLEFEKENKQ